MERLVPLTKILMTLAVSVWAILLRDWASLLALVVVELVVLFVAGLLIKQRKAVMALTSFAVFLGVIQFLGSGDVTSAIVSGLRMLAMTLVFICLLATTKLQDLGLTKPPSVELSLAVPSLGYCKSMDELKSKLVAQLSGK